MKSLEANDNKWNNFYSDIESKITEISKISTDIGSNYEIINNNYKTRQK